MSKILIVADNHIHDYTHRCPSDKARLYQTRLMSQNIIKAGKSVGATIIAFAGDIIEKSLIRPYIQAEVQGFLSTIMAEFQMGYIIYGNHDIDTRNQEQGIYDSCLGLILPPNLYYADQRIAEIDGCHIGFSNWKPTFDLSWIPGKLDLLITHATIDYSKTGHIKSQVLDETKFDLAICGDIHFPAQTGKFVSVGVSQKCKMSDSDVCTGVVYDTITKTWEYVNLNPDDNLLKFEYTPDMMLEGYDPGTNTWRVFQPSNISLVGGVNSIQIPVWGEIQEMIENIIQQSGLGKLHTQILGKAQQMDAGEIDFMFTPLRLACHNWRSIDDAELYFQPGDKILIRGANGSGKSSLISAFKYALMTNNSIKDFVQTGTKECWTEIEFLYQGKKHRIRRGTKQYGLWVDDQEVLFKGVREFQKGILERYPFTDPCYMKLFFFDEDNPRLMKGLTEEETINLISKFFRLERIDLYNQIAQNVHEELLDKTKQYYEKKNLASGNLDNIVFKLTQHQVPGVEKEKLMSELDEAEDLRKRHTQYIQYLEKTKNLAGSIEVYKGEVSRIEGLLESCSSVPYLEQELSEYEASITDLEGIELQNHVIEMKIASLKSQLEAIQREGTENHKKLESLDQSGECPVCGQKMDQSHVGVHLAELQRREEELLGEYNRVSSEIQTETCKLMDPTQTRAKLSEYRQKESDLKADISRISQLKADLAETQKKLEQAIKDSEVTEVPEKVDLPEGLVYRIAECQRLIGEWDTLSQLQAERDYWQSELDEAQRKIDLEKVLLEQLSAYMDLTNPVGKIYEAIMNKLSTEFSDSNVKYEVKVFNQRTKNHLQLIPYFNHGGVWYSYQTCSSGQKTFLDINFMSKIITGTGVLMMDEFLKALDPENHDRCLEILTKIPVSLMMLSSHMETVANFYNKQIAVRSSDSGSTIIDTI